MIKIIRPVLISSACFLPVAIATAGDAPDSAQRIAAISEPQRPTAPLALAWGHDGEQDVRESTAGSRATHAVAPDRAWTDRISSAGGTAAPTKHALDLRLPHIRSTQVREF